MISLYTDGAYRISKNMGGWAYVFIEESVQAQGASAVLNTTNNRMEIQALLEGLKAVRTYMGADRVKIKVYSDSTYIINSASVWVKGWVKNGFKGKKNEDLWIKYLEISRGLDLEFIWVRGHSGNKYNDLCDQLASEAIDYKLNNNERSHKSSR